jgi:hypothetical protein
MSAATLDTRAAALHAATATGTTMRQGREHDGC